MGLEVQSVKKSLPFPLTLIKRRKKRSEKEDVSSVSSALKQCIKHEEEMDRMMTEIIRSSKTNYRFKANTNAILVIIGTILIASPIAFTWLKSTGMFPALPDDDNNGNTVMSLTNLNYFLGAAGIAAFVSTFYNKPQTNMTIAIADLAQMYVICNMYRVQFSGIKQKLEHEAAKKAAIQNIELSPEVEKAYETCMSDIYKELSSLTQKTAGLIDKYIEKYARSSGDNNLSKDKDEPTEGSNQQQ